MKLSTIVSIATFISGLLCGLQVLAAEDCPPITTTDIVGTVWLDESQNSLLEGELGVTAIEVVLYTNTDVIYDTQFTVPGGVYTFEDVPEGQYYITISQTNFMMGRPLAGTDSCPLDGSPLEVDNDDNGIGDGPAPSSPVFTVDSTSFGQTIDYIDFCFEFDCRAQNSLMLPTCEEAADFFTCNLEVLEGFCSRMPEANSPGSQPIPLCPGEGAAHNISWVSFVAGSGDYSIEIDPFACTGSASGNEGFQVGVYTSCDFSESVFCSADCILSPVVIPGSLLEDGAIYHLFIDGCNGSVCSYTLEIEGAYSQPAPFSIDDICVGTDPTTADCQDKTVCVGDQLDFVLTGIESDIEYVWSVDDVELLTSTPALQLAFDSIGIYEVCLKRASDGCYDFISSDMCRIITVVDDPDLSEDFGTVTICGEDLDLFDPTFVFDGLDPNGDGNTGWLAGIQQWSLGENTYEVVPDSGCAYEQSFTLTEFPLLQTSLDTAICPGDTLLGLTEPGTYQLSYDDVNGCDSIVVITLAFLGANDPSCETNFVNDWVYDQNFFFAFPPPPLEQRVRSISTVGDTIIDGERYSVIEGGCSCSGPVRYLRSEGLQMYVYHSDNKHLLYDFSLQAGDILSIATPYLSDSQQDSVKVRIDSVSRASINGADRIVQHVDPYYSDESAFWADWGPQFMQGIGSMDWCLLPQFGLCEGGTGGIRCATYDDGSIVKFTADTECDIKSDIWPIGSQWNYRQWGDGTDDPLRTYRIVREDLINDDTYKILAEVDQSNNPIAETEIRLQTSRDQVYFLDDSDSLRLLYDFSSERAIGDTVTYYLPSNANLYDISSNGGSEAILNPYQYVIDSIGTVQSVNMFDLRAFDVRPLSREIDGEIIVNSHTTIIEGVGSMGTLIRRGGTQLLGGTSERFICYNGTFEYDYMLDSNCDLTATDQVHSRLFEVYPNPAQNTLQVRSDRRWSTMEVYDITGALKVALHYGDTVDISDLATGIYFLRLRDTTGSVGVQRFIKL